MVDLESNTMGLEGDEKIARWVVAWMTPFGPYLNYKEARKRVEGVDMDKNMTLFPVPVAISESGKYEIVSR